MHIIPIADIVVQGLTVRFRRTTVLDGLALEVPRGALFALLGPNGAGKTTLLRALAGIYPVAPGVVSLLGHDRARLSLAVQQRIGYVAEGQQLPHDLTVRALQRYLAPLYPAWDPALSAQLLERFGLPTTRRIGALSRGQRMQVALWGALAARPALLLMDEPFTGVDVRVKDQLVDGLLEVMAAGDTTVLLCTHDLAEVEMLADWLGILADGRVTHSAPLEQLRAEELARTGAATVTVKALYLALAAAPVAATHVEAA
jgi:ABC-2 type transport system ATP-binding protein